MQNRAVDNMVSGKFQKEQLYSQALSPSQARSESHSLSPVTQRGQNEARMEILSTNRPLGQIPLHTEWPNLIIKMQGLYSSGRSQKIIRIPK